MTKNNQTISADENQVKEVILKKCIQVENDLDRESLIQCLTKIINDLPGEWVKVISLIGGAASGKSSLAKNLTAAFLNAGIMADFMSTDDYVIGDRVYRREHFEGREPRAKYDFSLMNTHINLIRTAKEDDVVTVPTYDPITGIAIAEGIENYQHTIWKVAVLIIEGDFDEVEKPTVTFYLHMEDSDRLKNRIHRDMVERSEIDIHKIQENFQLRQITQHNRYTLPAIHKAQYIIDTHPLNGDWRYDVYTTKWGW
jgi:uridine kinase